MLDIRYALRSLAKSPGFAATAVLTLALATGATTAIFSILDSVLLRPLPFADPDRLVQVYGRVWSDDRGATVDPMTAPVGSAELEAYATQSTAFDAFAGYALTTRHLQGGTGVERLTAVSADFTFFDLLGVGAIAGRTFGPGDPPDVAVISANLWQRQFGRDPTLPGMTITLDGRAFTLLGVMPASFQFPYSAASGMPGALPESRTDVWVPIAPLRAGPGGALRQGRVSVTARLKPGVRIDAAEAELRVIARRVEQQDGGSRRVGVRLAPLARDVVGAVRRSLWMLFAAVGLVLAAACANVANLLLARATRRAREVSIRAALGAGRVRLMRLFLAESLVLSLAGGALGLVVAQWGADVLVALGSAMIPRAHEIALDWRTFAFLLLACAVTAVVAGLAPAAIAARADIPSVTKEAGGHATAGPGSGRIRDSLVIVEMSLAFVLALGAAIVVREAIRLQNVETGMVTDNVLTAHLTPRAPARDYYAIEERVSQLPGVQSAGFTQLVPLQNWGWEATVEIRGRAARAGEQMVTELRYVTPGYFRTLGIPIRRGRAFDRRDHADAPRVIVINESFARRYFPGEDPIGRETNRGTIVGVVGNVRHVRLDRDSDPALYYPAAQNVTMASDIGMSLLVRTTGSAEATTDTVRAAVRDVNPNLAVFNVKTMDQVLADSLWELRLYRWLIGLFAALALAIAAIGLYGVISYTAAARRREFAIRLALGSRQSGVARLVLERGLRLAAIGLAFGAFGALLLSRSFRELPLSRPDSAAFVAIAALLFVVAALACAIPALRVARLNPATALRQD